MARIEKTKSGKYRTRVYTGIGSDGKKHWKSITHEDKTTLKLIASEYEYNQNIQDEEAQHEYDTFENTADAYIAIKKAVLSPSTIRSYNCMLNTLKGSYTPFCALRMDEIDRDKLQGLINNLTTDKRSAKYVKNIYGLVSGVIQSADLTVPKVTLPQMERPNVYEPTEADVKATIEAAKGERIEIPIRLAIHGLRRGEICALKYPDDFDGNIVHIHKALVYVGNKTHVEKAPKNYTSDRYVPLDKKLVRKIEKQGYVTDYTPGALSEEFPDFLNRNGIQKYRFHDLRHFFVSYLHAQGYSDEEIMLLGGWKTDFVMKRNYRYALDKKGIAKKMQDTMKKLM